MSKEGNILDLGHESLSELFALQPKHEEKEERLIPLIEVGLNGTKKLLKTNENSEGCTQRNENCAN